MSVIECTCFSRMIQRAGRGEEKKEKEKEKEVE
jgi:hypothetical protein